MKIASENIAQWMNKMGRSMMSAVKLILKSHRSTISKVDNASKEPLIIMGNGPSLNDTIAKYGDLLRQSNTLAVNFAANAPQFWDLKPRFYVLADPHFFCAKDNVNVVKLYDSLARVDWAMTLFVPFDAKKYKFKIENDNIKVEYFNFIAVEGFDWVENWAYSTGRGMPRPRNVLIPSIMVALKMGWQNIYIAGADHSWTKTLSVNENNEVISIQPHFYKEDENEEKRIKVDYLKYPLHQIINSFYIAFKAYHNIKRYAMHKGVSIYNVTPESFIDAFPRADLGKLMR